jgi:hypothetical protein
MTSARAPQSSFLTAVAAAVVCTVFLPTAQGRAGLAAGQTNQRSVAVGVLDRSDAPVLDLSVDDVIVREDGVAREVVRVVPAPPPTDIVLLADDTQAAAPTLRELREALNGFANLIADLEPAPAVRVTTFGDRPTVLVDFTPAFSAVSRGIERIVTRPGAGATLLEAIDETASALRRRKAQRPVIVAFVTEAAPEFSNLRHTDIADALRESGASLWTVVLTSPRGGGSGDAGRERDIVIGDVTRQSGGRNQPVLSAQGLPSAFAQLAAQLASRWEITYGRPDTLIPPSKIEVEMRDSSRQVLAPRWVTR